MGFRTQCSVALICLSQLWAPGCLIVAPVRVKDPDPLRKQAVWAKGISGRTVTLADGRKVKLRGVSFQFHPVDPEHARIIKDQINFWVSTSEVVVMPSKDGAPRLVRIDTDDTKKYDGPGTLLLDLSGYERTTSGEARMYMTLIPIIIREETRADLGLFLIELGLCKPVPEEIAEAKLRESYVTAAKQAREAKLGIWMGLNERLRDAISSKDLKSVRSLLELGADPNTPDKYREYPLTLALRIDEDIQMVVALLDAGADPDALGRSYGPALHMAAGGLKVETVRLLLERGATIDIRDEDGHTPLYYAFRSDRADVVRLLLAKGASFEAAGEVGQYLYGFCHPGELDIARLLVARGADVNGDHEVIYDAVARVPIIQAAQTNALETAKFLLSKGAKADAKTHRTSALHEAVANSNMAMAKLLVSHGADVNVRGRYFSTPLHTAIRRRSNTEIVELLIAHGADVNARKRSWRPLKWAIAELGEDHEIVKILRSHGAKK